MPSKWHRRFTPQRAKQRKLHKRRSSSALSVASSNSAAHSTKTSTMRPSMGLFDEFGRVVGILVDCFLEVQIIGLRSHVSLRILLRNKSGQDVQCAIFRAKTAECAAITSAECYVDVEGRETGGLEYRDVIDHAHDGTIFQCEVGSIQSNRDCVVFLRYEHDLLCEDGAAILRFPLPGRQGEKLIARQKTQPGLWNASQMFSFIALDIQVADFPAKIVDISSSHSVSASIIDETNASVDVDDFAFMGQDEIEVRISSEPLDDGPPSHGADGGDAPTMSARFGNSPMGKRVVAHGTKGGIPVINVVDESIGTAVTSTPVIITRPTVKMVPSYPQESLRSRSRASVRSGSTDPPDIEIGRLYSDIWEISEARMSYSSSGEESTSSTRSDRLRRRKTTVHNKHLSSVSSNVSSIETDLSEMSWLDDPSDDEVNDEAERIFKEFSSMRIPSVETRESFQMHDEFDVEECKSIRIVRPHRPRIVHIPSPKIPHMISIENITPPSSPVRRADSGYRNNSGSNELLNELTSLLENLHDLIEESPTPYFLLDERFADTLGLQLRSLKVHPGAQALNLPETASWVREGIWANAIVLQFLKCVMESPFFGTLEDKVKAEYRLLYTLVEQPFSNHIQHLSPAARMTRVSEEELLELAGEIIQEQLIDGEEQASASASASVDSPVVGECMAKMVVYNEPFAHRPISPPKTPDDDDRKKSDLEAFVVYFDY